MTVNSSRQSSPMTGARQTMMSWARVIDTFESVPDLYKSTYQTLIGDRSALPYTVLAPAQAGVRNRKAAERLLCEKDETFYILERSGTQVTTFAFRYSDVRYFEVGNILLYSWFLIYGKTITGSAATVAVEFNEATLRHFEPFFCHMRPVPARLDLAGGMIKQPPFDELTKENFKFGNFARASLVDGERVIQSIYQPENRQPFLTVLGHHFYRTNFLAHLTILTDQEVILIGDVESMEAKNRSKYGGVHCYFPLRSLDSVTWEKEPNDLLKLTFHLSPDFQVERFFDSSHLPEIESLKKALEQV